MSKGRGRVVVRGSDGEGQIESVIVRRLETRGRRSKGYGHRKRLRRKGPKG